MNVAIIGGGAAGFFAALAVKENFPTASVTIFEKSTKILTKVKISGGGRCNVTNAATSIKKLSTAYPRGANKLKKAFAVFSNKDTLAWFESRGVPLFAQDDDRVFPVSQESQSIIDCFVKEVNKKKIRISMSSTVLALKPLTTGQIELIFKDNYDVGTTIIVHTNKEKLDDICSGLHLNNRRFRHWISKDSEPFSSWWYYLDTPEVVVNQVSGIRSEVFHNDKIISKSSLSSDWNEVVDTSLDGLYWRLNGGFPHLYCNGIIIQGEKTPYILLSYGLDKIEIRSLEICVFDNNGTFPLSLTRDHLVSDDFFEFEKLKSSVLDILWIIEIFFDGILSPFIIGVIINSCLEKIP